MQQHQQVGLAWLEGGPGNGGKQVSVSALDWPLKYYVMLPV